VEVGEQVLEVVGIGFGRCGHEVVAVEDDCGDAFVIGGSAAGHVGFFVEAEQRRAVQRVRLAVVMALRAVRLKILIAASLLRRELVKRRRRRDGVAAKKQRIECRE
jgi:hypothetical protein